MSEYFIIEDRGQFLVCENQDHCGDDGRWGMHTLIVYIGHSRQDAQDAIRDMCGSEVEAA